MRYLGILILCNNDGWVSGTRASGSLEGSLEWLFFGGEMGAWVAENELLSLRND